MADVRARGARRRPRSLDRGRRLRLRLRPAHPVRRRSRDRSLIRDLLGTNFTAQSREAYIYHHAYGLYTRFPFQAHLHGLPTEIVVDCLAGLVRAVERQARGEFRPRNYEEWMRGVFGDGIAERLMIPYARKVWTVEPREMDFAWIDRRVPTPDVERIIAGAVSDDVGQVGATAHFWYPKRGGIEALPRALGERVDNVQLGTRGRADRPRRARRRPSRTASESLRPHDLHAAALRGRGARPRLPPHVRDACARLRYQGICCLNLGIDRPDISDKHWVYFYEDEFPFHRLSFPGNFTPHNVPPGKSSISMEIAFSDGAPARPRASSTRPSRPCERPGSCGRTTGSSSCTRRRSCPAYVIYDLEHAANVDAIRSWLAEHEIVVAGRFGEWQYLNMDHAMKSGRDAARAVAAADVARAGQRPRGGPEGRRGG